VATLAGLVDTTRRLLYGPASNDRPQFDTLTATYNAANTTIPVDNSTQWKRGDILEFETDGLQLICTADGSSGTVAIEPYDGTDATHSTAKEILFRNPEWSRLALQDAINQTTDLWLWPHVWTWFAGTLTVTAGDTTYNLDGYIEEVVRMYQYNLASQNQFHPLPPEWWLTERQVNTAVSVQSNLLRVRRVHDAAQTVYYTARRRPNSADLSNISAEIAYLIPHGAAALVSEGGIMRERVDPTRGKNEEGAGARDGRTHTARFFIARDQLKALLRHEVPLDRRFQGKVRASNRSW
jgi:hypothetical protein